MSDAKQIKSIQKIQKILRQECMNIFGSSYDALNLRADCDTPIRYEIRERHDPYMQMRRLLIYLRGNFCSWSKESGGCTYCGFHQAKTKKFITGQNLLRQVNKAYDRYVLEKANSVALFNDGNYLNPQEIDFETQINLLKAVREWSGLKHVLIESRPEFINYYQLKKLKEIISPLILEINVGIDSFDQKIIKLTTNKGTNVNLFLRKAMIAKKLGIKVCSSIIYKPPFLTEKEAMDNAYNTIIGLLKYGINPEIEATTIQEGTFVYKLYQHGLYRPPWLWSLVALLKKIPDNKNVYLSPFGFAVDFIDFPHNCEKCTEEIKRVLFDKYEKTRNKDDLPDLLPCCGDEWLKEINFTLNKSLSERAAETLALLSNE